MDFLPEDRQFFEPAKTLGEALRLIAQTIAPTNTAKTVSRRWGLNTVTGDNIVKEIASGSTLVKAVRAEGDDAWALWDALGELLIGESRDTYDERNAAQLQERADYARQRLEDRRTRRQARVARRIELASDAVAHPALEDRRGAVRAPLATG